MKSRSIRFLALLIACVSLLCACKQEGYRLTAEDGVFHSNQKDITFAEAPMQYRAASVLGYEVVASISGLRKQDIPLYAIENMDPYYWLTDENYTLFYNTELTLPTLAELKPHTISLCWIGDNSASLYGQLTEANQAEIDDLVEILTVGTAYSSQKLNAYTPDLRFELLFHSKDYEGLYYVLEYWHFDSTVTFLDGETEIKVGKGVVYDRFSGCFYVMGDILESYFNHAQ